MFRYFPVGMLFTAGAVHLLIAPEHLNHAVIHGYFFAVTGVLQLLWAGAAVLLRQQVRQQVLFWSGVLLSGGVLVIWALTHLAATPFATEAHALDLAAAISKTVEALALVALLSGGVPGMQQTVTSQQRTAGSALLLSLAAGTAVWGVGMLVTPLLPELSHNHTHGAPTVSTLNTTAYFSIVNAGAQQDTLVRISGDAAATFSLHVTTIDAQDVARMGALGVVDLRPHHRIDFSPAGSHVMLETLPRNYYAGDVIPLTLHFASGFAAQVEFEVLPQAPQERVNFHVVGDFQISNAWIRATASTDGLVNLTADGYAWRLPAGFPLPRVPQNNPMSAEKVELGRYLFYDPRLSVNESISCSSCHLQALAFTDGRALPVGATGDVLTRNSPTLTNVAYYATLTWANPNLLVLERQIVIPMFGEHPQEMGITGNETTILNRFRADSAYRERFAAAFPNEEDPVTLNNILLALASFNRTLISGTSAYDRYVQGEREALSPEAQRGMALFFSEGLECHHCHVGFNFTLSTVSVNTTFEERPFFNTGLYNLGGTGAYPSGNTGIHEITNQPGDMGRFRPPTLRNIALTAPYMHDGSIATLAAVIRFYSDGGRNITSGEYAGDGRANPYKNGLVAGFTLTDQEVADLVAFLESLTDIEFITDPRFSDPFALPAANVDAGG